MFESGSRVQDTLADLADIMGGRDGAICREMTKLHEEIKTRTALELARAAGDAGNPWRIRAGDRPARGQAVMPVHATGRIAAEWLASRDSVKDAVAHAVELSGRPRREIYARALSSPRNTRCGR